MWRHCAAAVLALALLPALAACGAIRGLDPALEARYQPVDGKFACLDGEQSISFARVNDDYCDCRDGSDEPGGPAAATHQVGARGNSRAAGAAAGQPPAPPADSPPSAPVLPLLQAPLPAPTATSTARTRCSFPCCSTPQWWTTASAVSACAPGCPPLPLMPLPPLHCCISLHVLAPCTAWRHAMHGDPAHRHSIWAPRPTPACPAAADCCDGSDESAGRCQNTCTEKGFESLVSLKEQVGGWADIPLAAAAASFVRLPCTTSPPLRLRLRLDCIARVVGSAAVQLLELMSLP